MTALVSKHPSGHHIAAEEENDQRTPEKEMWTAGYKYSWGKMETAAQNRAEDGEKSVVCDLSAYVPPEATRLEFSTNRRLPLI